MFINDIHKYYNDLSKTERQILQYIMQNQYDIVDMTAQELADTVKTSKTAVINMCQKLGFAGFSDLKYQLKQSNVSTIKTDTSTPMIKDLSDEINKTLLIQDQHKFQQIIQIIKQAKTVYITGRGSSVPMVQILTNSFILNKMKAINVSEYNLLNIISEKLEPDDLMIILSNSGETQALVKAATVANLNNITTISITSFNSNTIQSLASHNLYYYSNKIDTKAADFVSRVGMHIVIQILITTLIQNNK